MQDRWDAGQVVYRTGRIIIIIINKRLFVSMHKIVQNIYICIYSHYRVKTGLK